MLILTRHRGQRILIGEYLRITITSVHGNHVELGIEAPPEVPVHRKEIYTQINHQEPPGGEAPLAGKLREIRGDKVAIAG